jgi:hypothetical protein
MYLHRKKNTQEKKIAPLQRLCFIRTYTLALTYAFFFLFFWTSGEPRARELRGARESGRGSGGGALSWHSARTQ